MGAGGLEVAMPVVPIQPKKEAPASEATFAGKPKPSKLQQDAADRVGRLFHANMGFSPEERFRESLYGPQHSSGEVVRGLDKVNKALAMSNTDTNTTFRYPDTTEERAKQFMRTASPSASKTPEQIKAEADSFVADWQSRLSAADNEEK